MKGFLLTNKGMEDIAALEVNEIINKKSRLNDGCIIFDINNFEDLFKLCYLSQSASGVYLLLLEFEYKDLFNDFKKNVEDIDFKEWSSENITFKVKCIKGFENNLSTPDLEKEFGAIIIEYIQKKY